MQGRLAAFDVSSILAVEANAEPFLGAHGLLRVAGFLFAVVPAVQQRLEYLRRRDRDTLTKRTAQAILATPLRLGLLMNLAEKLRDTEHDVVDIHVSRLIERSRLGDAQKSVLTSILEAAYLDCALFVTTDEMVLEHRKALTASIVRDCGMRTIYIFSAAEIVEFFSQP